MCREVSLFSARKVGDSVQTSPRDWARVLRWSWPETVRYLWERKKGSGRVGFSPSPCFLSSALGFPAERVKTSPAPSQSDEVMIGGWVWAKPRAEKKLLRMVMASERRRRRAAFGGRRERRWGRVRRNSRVWNLFWMG